MRVGSLLRREGRSHTESDNTLLSLLSQPIERVRGGGRIHALTSCGRQSHARHLRPIPGWRRAAAVLYRTYRELALSRAVRETIYSLGHDLADCAAMSSPRGTTTCTQSAHQLRVGGRRIGYHAQAIGLRELHHIPPITTGGSRDCDGLPRSQPELVEGLTSRQTIHRQSGGCGERGAARCADNGVSGKHDALAVTTMRAAREDHSDDLVSHDEVGDGAGADLIDHAGHVHARHVRRRDRAERLGSGAVSQAEVGFTVAA